MSKILPIHYNRHLIVVRGVIQSIDFIGLGCHIKRVLHAYHVWDCWVDPLTKGQGWMHMVIYTPQQDFLHPGIINAHVNVNMSIKVCMACACPVYNNKIIVLHGCIPFYI